MRMNCVPVALFCLLLSLLPGLPLPSHAEAFRPSTLGIAYQTWNRPLGIWQNPEQIEYDLSSMEKLGIRSLRVEFVWNHIEPSRDQFDFSLPDLLVNAAVKHGMKLYPIIGFQWPPDWFDRKHNLGFAPKDGKTDEISSIGNYADPEFQKRFTFFIQTLTRHFRGNKAIAAWVLGNEFSAIEYNSSRQLGYDSFSRKAYGKTPPLLEDDTQIDSKEARAFLNFRRKSIAQAVGLACAAAKRGDPLAMRTYSSIGVLYSQFDHDSTSEDFALIAESCRKHGAPLTFYSLNSYLNLNSREGFHLDISRKMAQALTGLPVIFTEFGATSTEEWLNIGEAKQAKTIRAQYLETIFDGISEAHLFTWNDKPYVSRRERGFGIVTEHRLPKPAFHELENPSR